jgi:hypothetical protein
MTKVETISILALIISLLSLGVNIWNAWRDRPRLLIKISHSADTMYVDITNRGRKTTAIERPIHLKFFDGESYPLMNDVYYPEWPNDGKVPEATKLTVRYPVKDWLLLYRPYIGLPAIMGIVVVDISDGRHYRRIPNGVLEWLGVAAREIAAKSRG